jgi:hypothetical protein
LGANNCTPELLLTIASSISWTSTNGVVVTNALKYIQGKTDHFESEKKRSQEGKGEDSKASKEPDYGEEEELEEGQEKDAGELEEEKTADEDIDIEKTHNDIF